MLIWENDSIIIEYQPLIFKHLFMLSVPYIRIKQNPLPQSIAVLWSEKQKKRIIALKCDKKEHTLTLKKIKKMSRSGGRVRWSLEQRRLF